jgi:hypothetical protein
MEERHDAKKVRELADELTRKLTDAGLIIEGGWAGFAKMVLPPDAPEIQRNEMRKAFFAGAMHLWRSVMTVLDPGPGTEPTERDLRRMSQIEVELDRFEKIIRAEAAAREHAGPAGTA